MLAWMEHASLNWTCDDNLIIMFKFKNSGFIQKKKI